MTTILIHETTDSLLIFLIPKDVTHLHGVLLDSDDQEEEQGELLRLLYDKDGNMKHTPQSFEELNEALPNLDEFYFIHTMEF